MHHLLQTGLYTISLFFFFKKKNPPSFSFLLFFFCLVGRKWGGMEKKEKRGE